MKTLRLYLVLWVVLVALMPHGMHAMQATPSPLSSAVRDRFIAGASRDFQVISTPAYQNNYFSISVLVFDSPGDARQAMEEMISTLLPVLPVTGDIRLASVTNLGDEAQAYLTETVVDDTELSTGLVFWRDSATVYFGLSTSPIGNPLTQLFTLGRDISGRPLLDTSVRIPETAFDLHEGGVWDLLPTLSDMPDGFVFVKEQEIHMEGVATPTP